MSCELKLFKIFWAKYKAIKTLKFCKSIALFKKCPNSQILKKLRELRRLYICIFELNCIIVIAKIMS